MPIDAIEKGIKQSAICLADITSDNPNVWYELGYAFASKRPVVMVCSEERTGKKYPFDIQHRSIIPYHADSPSDFDSLKQNLTAKLKAILEQDSVLEDIAESDPITPVHGLSQPELLVLAVVAGEAYMPSYSATVSMVKRSTERAGITGMGFNIAIRRLLKKQFIEEAEIFDEDGDSHASLRVTEVGWNWIDSNENQFVFARADRKKQDDAEA